MSTNIPFYSALYITNPIRKLSQKLHFTFKLIAVKRIAKRLLPIKLKNQLQHNEYTVFWDDFHINRSAFCAWFEITSHASIHRWTYTQWSFYCRRRFPFDKSDSGKNCSNQAWIFSIHATMSSKSAQKPHCKYYADCHPKSCISISVQHIIHIWYKMCRWKKGTI